MNKFRARNRSQSKSASVVDELRCSTHRSQPQSAKKKRVNSANKMSEKPLSSEYNGTAEGNDLSCYKINLSAYQIDQTEEELTTKNRDSRNVRKIDISSKLTPIRANSD